MEKHYDRIYAAIDLDAINYNIDSIFCRLAPNSRIMAVVKTDGYGHGAVPISRELEKKKYIFGFATATAEEALILRKAGIEKPILVLGYVFPYAYEEMISEDIRLTLFRKDMFLQLEEEARKQNKKAMVHIKVDTGMNRIGISADERGTDFIAQIKDSKWIEIEGIFTHFAKADYAEKKPAKKQLEKFVDFYSKTESKLGLCFPLKHCANSAATLEMPETHLDLVRVGISIYGMWPSEEIKRDSALLKPVFSLHSHIVFLKKLPKGEEISYGGTCVLKKETLVATIPVGYGDGYPRSLSGTGHVLIHGKKAPILGKVCMDQFMVDVTHIPQVKEGDEVTLIGSEQAESITMEEMGRQADRFNYELACVIGKRVPRIYLKKEKECYAKDYFDDYSFDRI